MTTATITPGPMYNDVVWNHDRHRMERRVIHVDLATTTTSRSGSVWKPASALYFKEGKLSDPDMHGRSARRRKIP
jgi:hypothetical protein